MQRHEQLVQQAVGAQHDDPAVKPHQRAGIKRDHHQHQHGPAALRRELGHVVAEGVAQRGHQRRDQHGQLYRFDEGVEIERFEDPPIVAQGEGIHYAPGLRPGEEAQYQHVHERPDQEHDREQVHGREEGGVPAGELTFHLLPPPRRRAPARR